MTAYGPTTGTVLDGVYRLQQSLGRGAAGQVWLAEDLVLKRRCAVKVVPPELVGTNAEAWRNALRREASAMANIRHPNVANVYAFGRHKDLHYFIMEWVDGETLAAEIDRRRSGSITGTSGGLPAASGGAVCELMPVRRALRIIAECCRGLAAVHAAGIVHRDIKPTNIMLARDGRVVLIDFGLVRMPDGTGPGGAPVGTPRYMAPELARPATLPPHDEMHLADIYSLSATAYELLTGVPPFPGEGAREVIERHLHEAPIPPSHLRPDLPPTVDRLILRGLAKRPRERYASGEDMRAAVSAVASRLRSLEAPPTAPRVLVVDDDPDFRSFVCSYVRRLSPEALLYTAGDGSEALDVARRVQPHLAVLDLDMPTMNGLELTEALSTTPETSRTRVMVISGAVGQGTRERAQFERLGVMRVFDKPMPPAQFIEAVQSALKAAA